MSPVPNVESSPREPKSVAVPLIRVFTCAAVHAPFAARSSAAAAETCGVDIDVPAIAQ